MVYMHRCMIHVFKEKSKPSEGAGKVSPHTAYLRNVAFRKAIGGRGTPK